MSRDGLGYGNPRRCVVRSTLSIEAAQRKISGVEARRFLYYMHPPSRHLNQAQLPVADRYKFGTDALVERPERLFRQGR